MSGASLPVRDLGFEFGDDLPLVWNPRMPELAVSANSISLLMPYVEPFIARSMRATMPELDEPLRERTGEFVRQELSHHVQHRRFNDVLAAQCPSLRRVEGWCRRTFAWMERKRSLAFRVAFAAGSETIAFAIARWAVSNLDTIFDGADPVAEKLFLWHLAEEVEHKTAAFDVFEATDGSRFRLARASALTVVLLLFFTFAGSLLMLRKIGRAHV